MPGLQVDINSSGARVSVQRLKSDLKLLGAETKLTEREIKSIEARFKAKMSADKTRAALNNLKNTVGLTRRELSLLDTKMTKSAAIMTTMRNVASRAYSALFSLKGAFLALGGAIVIRAILSVGSRFEQTMKTVGGVSRTIIDGQVTPAFERLTAIARKMGEETEWSATQAAEALKFLSMAGFEASDSIEALPRVLDLATAGNLELGRAADITTNALTAMGLEVAQLGRVNDVLINTITRSNTDMEMLAESFKYAAPSARAFGLNIEKLSALIGILGNAGIQGSMAGTQLAFAFTRTGKVFKELGMSGVGKDFIDALYEMNKAQFSAGKTLQIFGQRGGRAVLVLKELLPEYEALRKANEEADGAAKNLADTMRDTVLGKWKELKSIVESIGIDIFNSKYGKLRETIEGTTKYLRDNRDMIIEVASGWGEIALAIARIVGLTAKGISGFTSWWKRFNEGLAAVNEGLIDFDEFMVMTNEELQKKLDTDQVVLRWDKELSDIQKKLQTFQDVRAGHTGSIWTDILKWKGEDEATLKKRYDKILKYKQDYLDQGIKTQDAALTKEQSIQSLEQEKKDAEKRAQIKAEEVAQKAKIELEKAQEISDFIEKYNKTTLLGDPEEQYNEWKKTVESLESAEVGIGIKPPSMEEFIKWQEEFEKADIAQGLGGESMWAGMNEEAVNNINMLLESYGEGGTVREAMGDFFEGMREGWKEAANEQETFADIGKDVAKGVRSDWRNEIRGMVGDFIQGENDKINIQAAAGKVMANAAGRYATAMFDRILPRIIDQIVVSLGLGAASSGGWGAAKGGWPGALKDIGLFLGTGVTAMLAGRAVASKFHASGGWIGNHPTGGMIRQGSGIKDDVYMGSTSDAHHWAMGGEFVVNKKATAKFRPLIEAINSEGHKDGGIINKTYATGGWAKSSDPQKDANALATNLNIGGAGSFLWSLAKTGNPMVALAEAVAYYITTISGAFAAKDIGKLMGNRFKADGGYINKEYGLGDMIKNPLKILNPKEVWKAAQDDFNGPVLKAAQALLDPKMTSYRFALSPPKLAMGSSNVTENRPVIVGDGGEPEIFIPRSSGSVVPESKIGANYSLNVVNNITIKSDSGENMEQVTKNKVIPMIVEALDDNYEGFRSLIKGLR